MVRSFGSFFPEIKKDIIGPKGKLLSENLEVTISFYNNEPISLDLPKQIKCKSSENTKSI